MAGCTKRSEYTAKKRDASDRANALRQDMTTTDHPTPVEPRTAKINQPGVILGGSQTTKRRDKTNNSDDTDRDEQQRHTHTHTYTHGE